MKRLLFAVLGAAILLPSVALAQTGESIESFDVRATVEADRGFIVTEHIVFDFGTNRRHGIYRDIPVRYERNGGTYNLQLQIKQVLMDEREAPHVVSREGSNLRIKIGDAGTLISGRHIFLITYHTGNAINFFDGEGELYWNVTGNEWNVPITSTSFELTGPQGFDAASARTACFTGPFGSTAADCRINAASNRVRFEATRELGVAQGLTIVTRFPKGLIAEPTLLERVWQIVKDNLILALPLLTLLVMLWIWNERGRDPKGRGTVVPQYEAPRGMSPAEMAALEAQDVPMRTVTATILDLARRGYLKIEFGEEKGIFSASQTYTFMKVKENDGALSDAEADVFEGLFEKGESVALSDLKGKFYKHVAPFKTKVFKSLKTRGLFERNPAAVRGIYIGIATAIGVAVFWVLGAFITPLAIGAIIASAVIIAAVGWFMPRVTPEGAVALEEVKGFKWFLSVTEKDRLAFHNAPAIKPSMFHAFLPAAIAFGVEEQWAEQFKGLDVPPPDYATGSVLHHWMAMNFVHDLSRMNSVAAASAYAAPSSAGHGGSGFSGGGSGGGFGGGGGGSW